MLRRTESTPTCLKAGFYTKPTPARLGMGIFVVVAFVKPRVEVLITEAPEYDPFSLIFPCLGVRAPFLCRCLDRMATLTTRPPRRSKPHARTQKRPPT